MERWTNTGGPITVGGRPMHSSSAVPVSMIEKQGMVKWIRGIANLPTDLDAEGSDERNFQSVLSPISSSVPPPPSGHSTARPPLASPMRQSPQGQIQGMGIKVKKLWPGCLEGLIEIVGRYFCMLMIE
ncbi:hypothetical protein O181_017895 [Austropuccinia psidii MF-1]|uniref:Uncharacterized protein n=1 Tax=Austropuccinia psidii MF-1 TaxID=1389203 RepID=A0A9Q3GTH0_9BASI|nr:hypothetical protein [Austropuccinia psidii MF-1]